MSTLALRTFTSLGLLGLLLAAPLSASALTSDGCLAQKRKVWSNFRKCEGDVAAKLLVGKPADMTKCTSKLSTKLAKLSQKAGSLALECRYADSAGTVLDYDTGLQWEKKDGADGVANNANPHDVDNVYHSTQFIGIGFGFLDLLNDCGSGAIAGYNGVITGGFAGQCDWRLPTTPELLTLLAEPAPCGVSPCIDAAFGPTISGFYWASTIFETNTSYAWCVSFADGQVLTAERSSDSASARAVRRAF